MVKMVVVLVLILGFVGGSALYLLQQKNSAPSVAPIKNLSVKSVVTPQPSIAASQSAAVQPVTAQNATATLDLTQTQIDQDTTQLDNDLSAMKQIDASIDSTSSL